MKTDRRFDAYQQFVLDCKIYWSTRIYPELKDTYERKVQSLKSSGRTPPQTAADVQNLIGEDTLYRFYAWYERHLQRMKYSGHHGLLPYHEQSREEIEARLAMAEAADALEIDRELEMPRYYRSVDIHQHPGGVWSDSLAGAIYEKAAQSTTPLMQRHGDLHDRFTDEVLQRAKPRRLVDMGCGFGKSTRPFYREHAELDVTALDLAAPCLRVATLNAKDDQAPNVRFLQRDAADTRLEDKAYDTVTSTMLLHEIPPPHLEKVIAETYRLLDDGGTAVHLDFLVPKDDPFGCFIHYTHGRRNNEPFMEPLNEMDIAEAHRRAGFREVEIIPFEEQPGTLSPEHKAWRFPWTMIVARK